MDTTLTYPITSTRIPPLLAAVGNTPLLPVARIASAEGISPGVRILAKAEWFNPGGSVKDRPARAILLAALEEGLLTGKRLLDSTSGNMGIAYATLAPALGVAVTLTVPENASPERFRILRALGAEILLTDPLEGSDGAILAARELAEAEPDRYFYADQYGNPANWQAHFDTTGPEILDGTGGEITHFIAGLGTSGTMMGAGRFLRENVRAVQLIAFQPDSPFHGLEGLKHMASAIVPGIYDPDLADENRTVRTEDAHEMTRRLARDEGLFVGISSGAALVAALEVAAELDEGVVVTVFPDAGYKYLSDRLWEGM
jgi:cysteine synthase B